MRQYAIYFHDMILIGYVVASNPESAIVKILEREKWLKECRLVAKPV